jgi:predicted AlkP superfamily pyrophosphatase or phosphodiesterase
MKLLKVLVNSLLVGLVFCLLLAHLLAVLNINQRMSPGLIISLSLRLAAVYALAIALIMAAAYFLLRFFIGKRPWPGLISPSFLSLSLSLFLLLFLAIFWANTVHFRSFFDSAARNDLRTQAITVLVLALLGLATFFSLLPLKKKFPLFLIYIALLSAGTAFLLAQKWDLPRPRADSARMPLLGKKLEKKITMIGLEGLSFDLLDPLSAQGKLPNLTYLMENGCSARLVNFTPTEEVILRASLETGKFPARHRVLSQSRFRLGNLGQEFDVIPRFILFHQLAEIGYLQITPARPVVQAKDIWQILEENQIPCARADRPAEPESPQAAPKFEKLLSNVFNNPALPEDDYFQRAKNAFFRDCVREEQAAEEKARLQPQVFYLYLDGLNAVQTYFYKYSFPQQFGSIDQDSLSKYGPVIENYYGFYDGLIGKYLTGLKEDEILVVFSPHGTAPLPVWKRFVERLFGDRNVSAYHEPAPDGTALIYGKGIARQKDRGDIRIVDLAPTLLYYLGLPVGRDMDGIVKTSIFLPEFTADNPIIYISSYEEFDFIPPK